MHEYDKREKEHKYGEDRYYSIFIVLDLKIWYSDNVS